MMPGDASENTTQDHAARLPFVNVAAAISPTTPPAAHPALSGSAQQPTESEGLQMSIDPVHPMESAFDTAIRFATPRAFHCPPLQDAPSRVPFARRIAALIKGVECAPICWSRGIVLREDRSVAEIRSLKDAEACAKAAVRGGMRLQAAKAFCVLGSLQYNYGNTEMAIAAFQHALSEFEAAAVASGVAFCHNILGVCYWRCGAHKMAITCSRKAETLLDDYGKAVSEVNMGVSYAALGEACYAKRAFEDAVANATRAGDEVLQCIALGNLGLTCLRSGDLRNAQLHLERCLEQCSTVGDRSGAALCLLLLGEVYSLAHDYPHALFYYEHAQSIGHELRHFDVINVARLSIGIARGQSTLKSSLLHQAAQMGAENDLLDIVPTLSQ